MSGTEMLDIEECITKLSVCFGKLEYLISVISQKLEKNTDALTEQEREFYIFDRDNMRTNLDIAEDYINEASGIRFSPQFYVSCTQVFPIVSP